MASRRHSPVCQGSATISTLSMDRHRNHNHEFNGTSFGAAILLSRKQIPFWYIQPYIETGYRPVRYSVDFCFQSFTYLHNETANIFTHLIPALITLVMLFSIFPRYFESQFPEATRQDRLIFEIYLLTSFTCFAVSTLFHTLLCHSQHYFDLWIRFDYVAIVFQIVGSFISGIYVGFYCEPNLQAMYWSMVGHKTSCPPPVPGRPFYAYKTSATDWYSICLHSICRCQPEAAEPQMALAPNKQLRGDWTFGIRPHRPCCHHLSVSPA